MYSIKESVLAFLAEQPEDVPAEKIIDFILLQQKIQAGQKDLREGRFYTHEEAKKILIDSLQKSE